MDYGYMTPEEENMKAMDLHEIRSIQKQLGERKPPAAPAERNYLLYATDLLFSAHEPEGVNRTSIEAARDCLSRWLRDTP